MPAILQNYAITKCHKLKYYKCNTKGTNLTIHVLY